MNALTKNIIIIVLGGIACSSIFYWGVHPIVSDVAELNKQLADKKLTLAHLDQQIRAFQNAESDLNRAADKDMIAGTILAKEDLETAISRVELAAARSGVSETMLIKDPFLEVKPAAKAEKPAAPIVSGLGGIREVAYTLNTASTYTGLIDFLSYLESHPNFTELVKMELSAEIGESTSEGAPLRTGRVIGNLDYLFFILNATTETQNKK